MGALDLPPSSAFPRFALCVLEQAAIRYGALPELVRAVQQLDAAVVVNGSVVEGRRRLASSGPVSLGALDFRVGSLEGVGGSLMPASVGERADGVHVEAVGLRVGELGRRLLADLTNASSGASWVDELTLDAGLTWPWSDSVGPSLAVQLRLAALPGASVVRGVTLAAMLHNESWLLSVAAAFELAMGNSSMVPPLSVGVQGAWALGERVVLRAAQQTTWERAFGLSWLEVQNLSVAVAHEASGAWSVAAHGRAAVSCGELQLRAGASVEVGGSNGSTAWSLRPTELPPVSAFPSFALCVVRSAAAAAGAPEVLLAALSQLEVAVVSGLSLIHI